MLFFKYVNSKLSNHKNPTCITDKDGAPLYDNVRFAQEFNRYFASVYTIDNKILPVFSSVTKDVNLSIIYFDVISIC